MASCCHWKRLLWPWCCQYICCKIVHKVHNKRNNWLGEFWRKAASQEQKVFHVKNLMWHAAVSAAANKLIGTVTCVCTVTPVHAVALYLYSCMFSHQSEYTWIHGSYHPHKSPRNSMLIGSAIFAQSAHYNHAWIVHWYSLSCPTNSILIGLFIFTPLTYWCRALTL